MGYEPEEKQVFREYEGPVSLSLPEEGSASYRAEAYCEDEAGNRSPTVTGVFRKSMVTVRKPVVVGVSGERLFNTPTVSLRVSPASVGDVVRYSFTTDGTEPDFPGPESPRAESVLSFDGASGSEVVYRVLFRLLFRGRQPSLGSGGAFFHHRSAQSPDPGSERVQERRHL